MKKPVTEGINECFQETEMMRGQKTHPSQENLQVNCHYLLRADSKLTREVWIDGKNLD